MAFSWLVYTPMSSPDVLVVQERLREAIAALLKARPALRGKAPSWGEVAVEEAVPSADDVAELSEAYGRDVSEEVLDRLDLCRSAISVERAGVAELDALQVSILRFLLDSVGPCLVDWGDMQVVLSEDVETELSEYESAGDLRQKPQAEPEAASKDGTPAVEEAGLLRSQGTEAAIEALSADPFLDRRFQRALEDYPDYVESYVRHITVKGAVGDAAASAELGIPVEKLAPHLAKLHTLAKKLAAEAEPEEDED